ILILATAAVCVLTGCWKQAVSPGTLHAAHSAWANDCSTCHESTLRPTASSNGLNLLGRLNVVPIDPRSSDALCRRCHLGPAHHPSMEKEEEVGSCSSCHHDHRGEHAALSRVSDGACTRCHANLAAHRQGVAQRFADTSHFVTAHEGFRIGPPGQRQGVAVARDPGQLHFNHALHLSPGQKLGDSRSWTLG